MSEKRRVWQVGAAGASAAVFGLAAAAAAQVSFRTIVLQHAPAPGVGADATFGFVDDPRISESGDIAFWAELAGTGIDGSNDGSLWTDRSGSLAMVLREGNLAPVGTDLRWAWIGHPAFFGDGRLGLTASIVDPADPPTPATPIRLGLFAEDGGLAMAPIAVEQEPAPGLPDTEFSGLPVAAFNASGATAFGAVRGAGLWSTRAGSLDLLLGAGLPPPDGPADQAIDFLDQPAQNAGGTVAFRGSFAVPGERFPNYSWGLWAELDGAVTTLAITGSSAPGTPAGVVFGALGIEPALSDAGRVAFWGALAGDGVEAGNDAGLWAGPAGAAALLAREGDPAPGAPGAEFSSFSHRPAQNGAGAVAFVAHVAGAGVTADNNAGLWVAPADGVPLLLAREGEQVPGLPAGVVFAGFGDPVMSESGQVVFLAHLAAAGVALADGTALMATDRAGRLVVLVRTGDSLDVDGAGDVRVVRDIVFDPAAPGTGRGPIDSAGTVVLKLTFQDRTEGLFAASARCLADANGDGALDFADFAAYRQAFLASDLRAADFDGDGSLSVGDFTAYRAAFFAGCP